MLKQLIKKEIHDNLVSPKFIFTFLLSMILIIMSLFIGIINYKNDVKSYHISKSLNKKNLENQSSYKMLASVGLKEIKSPQVLGIISNGISDNVGRVASITIAHDPNFYDSKQESNSILAIFDALDLTFIVQIVLSLFAILFSYDAIVGERERGTLKLLLSNSIPRHVIILSKVIGGYISMILPLLIPMFFCIIILFINNSSLALRGEHWARIFLIFLLYFIYLSVFFTLGLFVSTRTTRSSSSLLLLLFIWIFFITIFPKLAVITANQIYKVPSKDQIIAEKEANLLEIQDRSSIEVMKWINSNRELQKNPSVFQSEFKKYMGKVQDDFTLQIDKKNNSIENNYNNQVENQRRTAVYLARISPSTALSLSSMRLAKTGIDEHENFVNSIRVYKPIFTKWINKKIIDNIEFSELPFLNLEDLPVPTYSPESLKRSVLGVLPDFAILLSMTIIFFVCAYVSFLRYEI